MVDGIQYLVHSTQCSVAEGPPAASAGSGGRGLGGKVHWYYHSSGVEEILPSLDQSDFAVSCDNELLVGDSENCNINIVRIGTIQHLLWRVSKENVGIQAQVFAVHTFLQDHIDPLVQGSKFGRGVVIMVMLLPKVSRLIIMVKYIYNDQQALSSPPH